MSTAKLHKNYLIPYRQNKKSRQVLNCSPNVFVIQKKHAKLICLYKNLCNFVFGEIAIKVLGLISVLKK